jgi:anti-sigma factor RsiW
VTVEHEDHVDDSLSPLLDDELSPAEAAAVRAHIDVCHRCRDELAATERVRALVRGLPSLDLPAGVGGGGGGGAPRRRVSRLGAAAAAAVGVAASMAFLVLSSPTDSSVRPEVGQLVDVHATSGVGGDPVSQLTPAAIPVSFQEP